MELIIPCPLWFARFSAYKDEFWSVKVFGHNWVLLFLLLWKMCAASPYYAPLNTRCILMVLLSILPWDGAMWKKNCVCLINNEIAMTILISLQTPTKSQSSWTRRAIPMKHWCICLMNQEIAMTILTSLQIPTKSQSSWPRSAIPKKTSFLWHCWCHDSQRTLKMGSMEEKGPSSY